MSRHRASAGVGEQVNQYIIGRKKKHIVMSRGKELLALSACGPADGLDALDTERLNDGADGHGAPRQRQTPASLHRMRAAGGAQCPAHSKRRARFAVAM